MAKIKAGTYTSTKWNTTNGLAECLGFTPVESGVAYSINFSSDGEDFTSLTTNWFSDNSGEIYYGGKLVGEQLANEYTEPYNSNYRIITIPYDQEVNDNFAQFLNVFYGVEEAGSTTTPTDAVAITYNNTVVASLAAGQTAIVRCMNKFMRDDVVITVPEGMGSGTDAPVLTYYDGTVVYGSSKITISFTIDGDHYEAEEGMTWLGWVGSSYNTEGFTCSGNNSKVYYSNNRYWVHSGADEYGSYTIVADKAYELRSDSGSSN